MKGASFKAESNKADVKLYTSGFTAFRNNGNTSPRGPGSPNESEKKRFRRPYQSKTFKVEISFTAKISTNAIASALFGQESENSQDALRLLDII